MYHWYITKNGTQYHGTLVPWYVRTVRKGCPAFAPSLNWLPSSSPFVVAWMVCGVSARHTCDCYNKQSSPEAAASGAAEVVLATTAVTATTVTTATTATTADSDDSDDDSN
jgi:hypothetical protein